MKIHRTREQWLTLFEQQQRSGLNKTQFCRQHGITRSAFSNARHRLTASNHPDTAFVPALPSGSGAHTSAPSDTLPDNAPPPQACQQLALTLPGATLSLPVDISPRWLATLLREMTP